ncbi:N-acetylglucosamine kinase [Terriglobus aquaticus]|uniref:N-acetylglucosamine kinase n=1 Tax=Terriglobus aquaticus TaxID=940139 RepID=A0ABW9KKY6_9BACT|nr:BadF/BadG/BcrA/BcrD ATPase family protein [Terriglobus aquaticus]
MPLYLGVDAGGTTTTYVLADAHQELARAQGGSIKRMRVAADVAEANLEGACADLERRSGRSLREVTRTCIGAAGFSVPLVSEWLATAFAERTGGELLLVGDVVIALDAAFQGGRGVLALAGTGSNVAARTADGRVTNAGGWGPAVSDEGSGHAIGRDAVRAAFRSIDSEEYTVLTERIAAFWQVDLPHMVGHVNMQPPPDFTKLVPLVSEAAREGDVAAQQVLRNTGHALGETTLLAIAKVRRMEGEAYAGPPPVAFAGSVLRYVEPVRSAIVETLRAEYPSIAVLPDVIEPVQGALWRARANPEAALHEAVSR